MKIARPRLPAQPLESSLAAMANDGELEDAVLRDEDGANCNIAGLELSSVAMEKMLLTGAHFSRVVARDLQAKQSDFSAAHLDNGALVRVEFSNCRMTGTDFNQASIHDVVFRGCKLDMANFRQAELRRVQFVDCTLTDTDFINARLTDVEFQSCVLEKTTFSQATCKQVDLRTSQLIDINGWRSLKGAIIDTAQLMTAAPYLAQELGITVRNG